LKFNTETKKVVRFENEVGKVTHKVYRSIINAVKQGKLIEPFGSNDFRRSCPGLGEGTYNAFLYKHRKDNPGGNSELFEMVSSGKFKLIKPFKYGFDR
jgi:hypothetical protein